MTWFFFLEEFKRFNSETNNISPNFPFFWILSNFVVGHKSTIRSAVFAVVTLLNMVFGLTFIALYKYASTADAAFVVAWVLWTFITPIFFLVNEVSHGYFSSPVEKDGTVNTGYEFL